MPAVAESIGYGSTLYINDGASNAYAQAFNLVDMTPPHETLGTTTSKRLDSPGGVIGKVATMFTPGQSKATFQFDSVNYARFETLRKAKTNCNFKFTVNGATAAVVTIAPGFVTECAYSKVEGDKIVEFEVSFEGRSDVAIHAALRVPRRSRVRGS